MSEEKEIIIDGVDVSECCYMYDNEDLSYMCQNGIGTCFCRENKDCYFKQLKCLQQENEKIKKQYNCYACGNCNGKEDYINLEKHHKGLRKQFDEVVKRNNTLSLRIEELENEKEKSKEYFKDLQVRKDRYYLQVLEYEKQISDWITFYIKINDIVSGNYEILDSQGLQDLRQIISEVVNDRA